MIATLTENGSSREIRHCLEVRGLIRNYGLGAQVGPISFSVHEGEFFSLLGPSGCGKTTTLRAIAGFESVDEGEILLKGKPIQDIPPNKRGIGLVFQRHALFPHINVWDNVAFGLKQQKCDRGTIAQRCRSALDLVGLQGFEKRWPAQLSGGQQQRVALARSLVLEPALLLLDEPMSSLDLKLRVQMREELRGLQKRLKKTTIFVTHDQTEALAMSDRIAVLSNGQIEQIGTPWEIYNRPATRFVATFIGRSNQFEIAEIKETDGQPVAVTSQGLALVVTAKSKPVPGAVAVIRAESVRLAPGTASLSTNTFRCKVIDREYLGEDIQHRVVTEEGVEMVSVRKATNSDSVDLVGSICSVSIDPAAIFLLS